MYEQTEEEVWDENDVEEVKPQQQTQQQQVWITDAKTNVKFAVNFSQVVNKIIKQHTEITFSLLG